MNDLREHWTGINYINIISKKIYRNMISFYTTKRRNFFFNISAYYCFLLFNILKNNIIIKINSIIDMIATHYPDSYSNEFELLYVNLYYRLNFRFFIKYFIKKENLLISLNNIFNSTA